ncbi:Serine/threonine-protein kinase STK11 [Nowakowskiella sp. JEL0407]|nr:Serine/threonine-protein kinase STK11 [Nowakowskiella sp. JEL0407]
MGESSSSKLREINRNSESAKEIEIADGVRISRSGRTGSPRNVVFPENLEPRVSRSTRKLIDTLTSETNKSRIRSLPSMGGPEINYQYAKSSSDKEFSKQHSNSEVKRGTSKNSIDPQDRDAGKLRKSNENASVKASKSSIPRSYSTFQGQRALVNSVSRKQSILDVSISGGNESPTEVDSEVDKPKIIIYPRKSVIARSSNSLKDAISYSTLQKRKSASEQSVSMAGMTKSSSMSRSSFIPGKRVSSIPIHEGSVLVSTHKSSYAEEEKLKETEVDQLRVNIEKSESIKGAQFISNSTADPTSVMSDIGATEDSYRNNPEYYEYLMLCQRHASSNFIHKIDSAEVVWQEKAVNVKMIGPYLLGDQIGKGAFGKVKEGLCSETLQRVAIKIINKKRLRKVPNGVENVHREIKLLRSLKHKNVIKLIDVVCKVEDDEGNIGIFNWFSTIENEPITWTFDDGTEVEKNVQIVKWYLVFEYCPCSLQTLLEQAENKCLSIAQAHHFFVQLIEGLAYLHSRSVIHHDIKPHNLLITADGVLKISDFGIAEEFSHYDGKRMETSAFGGTHQFIAPEIADGSQNFDGCKVDIWACGITLYNMITGRYPFEFDEDGNVLNLYEKITFGKYQELLNVDADCQALIAGMLTRESQNRYSVDQILSDPWFQCFFNKQAVPILAYPIADGDASTPVSPIKLPVHQTFIKHQMPPQQVVPCETTMIPFLASMFAQEIENELEHVGRIHDLVVDNEDDNQEDHFILDYETFFRVLLALLALVLLNVFWVGYSFSRNDFKSMWLGIRNSPLRTLRATLDLFATVLYNPILSVFTLVIVTCGPLNQNQYSYTPNTSNSTATTSNDTNATCWSGLDLLFRVSIIVVTLVFIVLVISATLTIFEPDPKKKVPLSRPHARVDLMYLAQRTILVIVSGVLMIKTPYSRDARLGFSLLCVVSGAVLAFSYTWYLPYYHFRYNCLRSALMFNFLWAAICFTFNVFRPESDIGIIYFFVCPLIMGLSVFLNYARRRMIIKMPLSSIKHSYIIELKVRFKLEDAGLLYKDMPAEPIHLYESTVTENLIQPSPKLLSRRLSVFERRPSEMPPAAIDKRRAASDHELNGTEEKKILEETSEIFQSGLKLFPESCYLHLAMGQFFLCQLGNRPQCLALYSRALGMKPQLDEAFLIYRRQQLLSENFLGGDVIDFIAYENHLKLAKRSERRATRSIIQFWGELLRANPDIPRLQKHCAVISHAVSAAQLNYTAMIKLSPETVMAYRLYGTFLMDIMNDKKNGKTLLQHASDLDDNAENDSVQNNMVDPFSLAMLQNSGTVKISGDVNLLGRILDVNPQSCKILGWRRHELIGQNVSKIIPRPFSDAHDHFLRRYLETGFGKKIDLLKQKIIDRQRTVLTLLKSGYITPAYLCVKQLTEEGGSINFIASLRLTNTKMPEGISENYMIAHAFDFRILHFTEDCNKLFNIKPQPVTHNTASIYEFSSNSTSSHYLLNKVLPQFDELGKQYLSRTGARTKHVVTGKTIQTYDLFIAAEPIDVLGQNFYIVRIKSAETTGEMEVPKIFIHDSESKSISDKCPFSGKTRLDEFENIEELPMSFSPSSSRLDLSKSKSKSNTISGPLKKRKLRSFKHSREYSMSREVSSANIKSIHTRSFSTASNSANTHTGSASFLKTIIFTKQRQAVLRLSSLKIGFGLMFVCISGIAIYENILYGTRYEIILRYIQDLIYFGNFSEYFTTLLHHMRSLELTYFSPDIRLNSSVLKNSTAVFVLLKNVVKTIEDNLPVIASAKIGADLSDSKLVTDGYTSKLIMDAMIWIDISVRDFLVKFVKGNLKHPPPNLIQLCRSTIVSLMYYAEKSRDKYGEILSSMMKTEILRGAFGPGIFLMFTIGIIVPIYVRVKTYKISNESRFFKIFTEIPKEAIRGIYEVHYQRLQVTEDEDYASENEDNLELNLLTLNKLDPYENKENSKESSLKRLKTTKSFLSSASIMSYFLLYRYSGQADRLNLFQTESLLTRQISFQLREEILAKISNSTINFQLFNVTELVDKLKLTENTIFFGNKSSASNFGAITDLQSPMALLFLKDLCGLGESKPTYDLTLSSTDCESFASGIMRQGFHPLVLWFISQAAELNSDLKKKTFTDNLNLELRKYDTILQADFVYMAPNFEKGTNLLQSEINSDTIWFITFHRVTTGTFIGVLILIYIFILRKLFQTMTEESSRTTMMLHMIPPELLQSAKSVKDWVDNDLIKKDVDLKSISSRGAILSGDGLERVKFSNEL